MQTCHKKTIKRMALDCGTGYPGVGGGPGGPGRPGGAGGGGGGGHYLSVIWADSLQ